MNRSLNCRLALTLSALALTGWTVAARAQQPSNAPPAMQGLWMGHGVTVSGDKFQTLETYTADGEVLLTFTGISFPRTGHGVWRQAADGRIEATSMFLIVDAQGSLADVFKENSTITLGNSGNDAVSQSTWVVTDASGNRLGGGTQTVTLKRIQVQPQ